MKIINLLLICAAFNFSAVAGATSPVATKAQVKEFLKSKTCIVTDSNNISFRAFINDAVRKYWKITEYEFINQQEFESRRYNAKYSFLMLTKSTYEKDPAGISYGFINLVLGDTSHDISRMPELCSIPVSYYSDNNNTDYGYAVPAILNFMQKHVKKLLKRHVIISLEGLKFYNGILKLNDKTLLLNKGSLAEDADSPDKIKKVYPYSIKLLTIPEIEKTLDANPPNTAFNFHVGPQNGEPAGQCFEMIFDNDGNLYYYKARPVTNVNGDGFNLQNFEDLK